MVWALVFTLREVRKKPLDGFEQRSVIILLKKLKDHSSCYFGTRRWAIEYN